MLRLGGVCEDALGSVGVSGDMFAVNCDVCDVRDSWR